MELASASPTRAKIPKGVRFAAASVERRSYCAPVRADGSPSSLRDALATGWRELALYLATGVVYIAIGVTFPEFLFSWAVAAGYLLACVVLLPALVRLARR